MMTNETTTEEARTPGQIAHDAAYNLPPDSRLWQGQTDGVREFWNRAAAALAAALATPRADRAERTAGEVEATQITLGEGMVDITHIDHEGRTGVLFRPRKERIPFGEPGELPEGTYWPVKGDVVLWVSGEGPGVAIKALADLTTPAPSSPGVPDSVRKAIAFASEAEGAKNGPAARRYAALRCLGWVETLLSAHADKQTEPPVLRAVVDVFADRTDTRLSFGDRTAPELGVKAVQQAIAALTAEYEARGGCPVVGRHPAGQNTATVDAERRVADAIDAADGGYSIRLVGLTDGAATYSLDLGDGELLIFSDREEAREHALKVRSLSRARAAIAALSTHPAGQSTGQRAGCAARRQGSAGGNDPADCDWPMCGCDPHADKVIAALQESGHLTAPDSTRTGQVGFASIADVIGQRWSNLVGPAMDGGKLGWKRRDLCREFANAVREALTHPIPAGKLPLAATDFAEATWGDVWVENEIDSLREFAALAARPAAPEAQGAWNFDMEAAPRDGTRILITRESETLNRFVEIAAWRKDTYGKGHWALDGGFQHSWHRAVAWRHLDEPAPPASSGQGGR